MRVPPLVCVPPGVFLSSTVTGACPVTTDLTMRDNVRTATTIRLCVGKLLVNLWQVVKRTDTPLIPQQMASTAGPWGFWVVGFNPTIHNKKLFQTFPSVKLEKHSSPWYPQEMKPLGYY